MLSTFCDQAPAALDFVDSLCNVLTTGFVTLLSRKLIQDLQYEYNDGVGKIETISSLC
ncbi:MAG: hypothetical protein ACI4QW_01405 [Clostridia bacterium]